MEAYEGLLLVLMLLFVLFALVSLILALRGENYQAVSNIFVLNTGGFFGLFGAPASATVFITGPSGTQIPYDFLTDNFNCGGTGIQCSSYLGQVCINGVCQCPASAASLCTGIGCVDTTSAQYACGSCTNSCTGGSHCCASQCTDVLNSVGNCNGCGLVCTGIAPACCSGNCRDLNSNNAACGSCFNACPSQGGQCCTGVCAQTLSDNNNCGGCGIICPPNYQCQSGICVTGCAQGNIICSGNCVDPTSDNFNCSGCDLPCGAGTYCNSSACIPNTCNQSGQVFCPNGLCINILTSQQNCSQCGNNCSLSCQLINGAASCFCQSSADCGEAQVCSNNTCVFPTCPMGLTFCGYSGTCVNLTNDALNCSSCGVVCGSQKCVGGLCTCSSSSQCPLGMICVGNVCIFN
jgi:Stigma-specific protein, Stig1